jgi:hypothetical protein
VVFVAENYEKKFKKLVSMLENGLFPCIKRGDIVRASFVMANIIKSFPGDFLTQAQIEMLYEEMREEILKRGLP